MTKLEQAFWEALEGLTEVNSLGRHRREFSEIPGCPLGTHGGHSHSREFSQTKKGSSFQDMQESQAGLDIME